MSRYLQVIRRLIRPVLFLVVMATVSLVGGNLPIARAQAPVPLVTSVRFAFVTGGDDLRAGSQAFGRLAFLDLQGSEHVIPFELNRGQRWPDFEVKSVEVPLPPNVLLAGLRWFDVAFTSGSSGPFDTGDHWNLQAVYATANLTNAAPIEVFRAMGDPLHRFRADANRLWGTAFRPF